MATWIAHLRVAEIFKTGYSKKEYQSFLIGNIAPDAGMLNADKKTYTPSTEISHYRNTKILKWGNDNLKFYKDYLENNENTMQHEEKSFKIGYFHHLFLDDLWRYYIHLPTKRRYQKEFRKNALFIWEIKKDWYGIDKEYLRENPDWYTWVTFLESEYDKDFLDFYPQAAIADKIKSIKTFYSQTEDLSRPGKYLQAEEMTQFVELASHWIKEGIRLLNNRRKPVHHSIMNLLEEKYYNFRDEWGNMKKDYRTIIGTKMAI
jgi:hypothetical protein